MATAWKVAVATAVVGWFISPVIALLLPKILSSLGFDAKKKLEELEFHIMPELQKTLTEVDQVRMMQRGEATRVKSDLVALDKMAAKLRRAREEAEDIVDDHAEIESYRNTCSQRLCGTVKTCAVVCDGAIARCLGIVRIVQRRLAQLLQWGRNWFKEPVQENAAPDNHIGVTIDSGVSHEEPVSEAMTSDSASVPMAASSFKSFCRSIVYWLLDTYEKACIHRDLFHKGAGITRGCHCVRFPPYCRLKTEHEETN